MYNIKRYGWVRSRPDARDIKYSAPKAILRALPPKIDLREKFQEVYDQGDAGSCTAQAIAGCCHYLEIMANDNTVIVPSRLFIYWCERYLEGNTDYDSGAQIRSGIKAINRWGYPDESLWPYDINNLTKKPTEDAYSAAKIDIVTNYRVVPQNADQIKSCLARGLPVIFGFTVHQSFESPEVASSGIMPMPADHEETVGGHAVLMVGYDNDKQVWIVRNSWGSSWGQAGYFFMPYAYALNPNLADDFWVINAVA